MGSKGAVGTQKRAPDWNVMGERSFPKKIASKSGEMTGRWTGDGRSTLGRM